MVDVIIFEYKCIYIVFEYKRTRIFLEPRLEKKSQLIFTYKCMYVYVQGYGIYI